MNNIDKLTPTYRCHDILDEKILSTIKKVRRDLFIPEKYKCFSYTDLSIPLESGEFMLTPSCEGKIMQAMDFNINDNVLIVGTGSGYLTECISHLTNTVSSYEIDLELFNYGKKNLDLYSQHRYKINLNHQSILDCLNQLSSYTKVLFTCSIDSYKLFIDYLGQNTESFFFINQYKSPYKTGIMISKARNSYRVNKNIVTSQTNQIRD
jgi:protein-L-isoaspartate(D-aspartate) O-methyltransferase